MPRKQSPDRERLKPKTQKRSRASIYKETDASQSRKKKSGPNLTGPAALGGIVGLKRAAASGALERMQQSGIEPMIRRSGDAYRRLAAADIGKSGAKINAEVKNVMRTGVGRSTPMQAFMSEVEGKKMRLRSSESFPQGEPSGKSPLRFQSPGNLTQALNAGKEARRGGRPQTAGPSTRPASGGGVGRGGSRSELRSFGGGGGEGGILRKKVR